MDRPDPWFLAPRWSDADVAALHEDVAVRLATHDTVAPPQRRLAVVSAMERRVRIERRRDVRWRSRWAAAAGWRAWARTFAAGDADVDEVVAAGRRRCLAVVRRGEAMRELDALLTAYGHRWSLVAVTVHRVGTPTSRR